MCSWKSGGNNGTLAMGVYVSSQTDSKQEGDDVRIDGF